jgi:serine/threonine protein kinase
MGSIYLAYDGELDRQVSLKVIRVEKASDPEIELRFKQELILARQITHRAAIYARKHDKPILRAHGNNRESQEAAVGYGPAHTLLWSCGMVYVMSLSAVQAREARYRFQAFL